MIDKTLYKIGELKTKIKELQLIQLYVWLPEDRLPWLKQEQRRIMTDKRRAAFLVYKGSQFSLLVDNIAEKERSKI